MPLDSNIPSGPLAAKWDKHKFDLKLVNPANKRKFDIIFCMNVMIYFTDDRRTALIQRFYEYLEPGGYLFVGHAESVAKAGVKFDTSVYGDCILYQKPIAPHARKATAAAGNSSGGASGEERA